MSVFIILAAAAEMQTEQAQDRMFLNPAYVLKCELPDHKPKSLAFSFYVNGEGDERAATIVDSNDPIVPNGRANRVKQGFQAAIVGRPDEAGDFKPVGVVADEFLMTTKKGSFKFLPKVNIQHQWSLQVERNRKPLVNGGCTWLVENG